MRLPLVSRKKAENKIKRLQEIIEWQHEELTKANPTDNYQKYKPEL